MKRAIVTGADGFIGRNLIEELLKNDYLVYAIVHNREKASKILGKSVYIIYIECDMNDYNSLKNHKELINCLVLFHLAWAGVSDKSNESYEVQLNNVKCACDLQNACVKLNIERFVFAGSIMEYEHLKAMEKGYLNTPLRNTYHVAKRTAKELLKIRCVNQNMSFLPAIISNVYGIGENSPRLVNSVIRALLKNEHMSFTPSEQLYDFIYINDAVKALRIVGEVGLEYKDYYVGNIIQRPLKEFLYEIRDVVNPMMKLGIGELAFKGVSLTYNEFDTKGLFKDFNFQPQISFKEGIKKTSDWIKTCDMDN